MRLDFFFSLFDGEQTLAILAGALIAFLVFCFLVGYFAKSAGLFAALAWLGVGCDCMVAQGYDCSEKGVRALLFFGGAVAGGSYVLLFLFLWMGKKRRERKELRAQAARKIRYALPEKYNSYVRDRLHTALQTREEEEDFFSPEEIGVRLGYAKWTAGKLKESALSLVERAEVDEMLKLLSAFAAKAAWSKSEMRAVNDIFARLLKLSAKHEIAIG